MLANNFFKNLIFPLAIFSFIFTALVANAAAQCGGVYFKRSSNTIVPTANAAFHQAEDMTGDGIPDLVGYAADSLQIGWNKIIILPANGSGGFGSPIVIAAPAVLESYVVGDFDTDAFKDVLVLLNTAPLTMLVYKNNGNGTFTAQTQTISPDGSPILLVDINNDGKGDYIGYSSGNNAYRYSLGVGDGTFGTPATLYQGGGHFIPGDFTNDGEIDFIGGTNLLINMGNGIFNISNAGLSFANFENVRFVKDFTGDGKLDLLTRSMNQPTIKVSLLTNNGNNTFSRTDYTIADNQTDASWYGDVIIGNFSGDSKPDFIYKPHPYTNTTAVFTNNGSGNFTRQDYNYSIKGLFTGDFDGDGKTDIASTTRSSIFQETVAVVRKNVCNQPGQTKVVDFNRDEQTDLTYWNPSNGNWSYKTTQYGATTTVNWGLGSLGDISMPGDYDKDGITDFAVYRNSTGVWYVRQSSNLAWYTIQWGVTGDKPVSQDYDGDGFTDIAVFRPSDGNWYVWYMGTQNYSITHFGSNGDKPVPEDYDGDGKTDLAVFRPSTGVWYYLKSSDGNYNAFQWGISTDKPVAADYDGDGRADIAVYRASEGNWYILRSSNGAYSVYQFGISTDLLQPVDYDGDGVFDAGIYRPSANTWYTSVDNQQNIFGASGVIPTASILRVE